MKIAQVTHSFPPYMSGTGNACFNYALELAKLGHDVTVFTYDYPKQSYNYPKSIKVKRLPYLFRIGNSAFMPGLLKELKGFDVIHLHFPFFFGAELVYLASKIHHIKYIVTYHNDAISDGLVGLYFKIYRHTIMKLILSNASLITISSLDYGRHSYINSQICKNPGKIIELPFGIDTRRFNENVDCIDVKTSYCLNGKKVVLFVGGLDKPHYFKGVDSLIKSFKEISDDAKLVIVGDGDMKPQYMSLARQLGIEEKVIFVGHISDEDLPKYYAASDVFVLPSEKIESFGIVLLEAMATGKPVIASNLPGVRTVVDDGDNGFLVAPKDVQDLETRIKFLLNDTDLAHKFGIKGRKKVEEKYSWPLIGEQLDSIYKMIL